MVLYHLLSCSLFFILLCTLLCTLTLFSALARYNSFAYTAYAPDRPFGGERGSSQPVINDPNLKLELVSEGLQLPTQMAFIGPNDILVLEKDSGMVKRIVNGVILEEPVLDVNVATAYERGLLGIAIAENENDNEMLMILYKEILTLYIFIIPSLNRMPMMIALIPVRAATRMSPLEIVSTDTNL